MDWPPAVRAELVLRPQLLAAASTVPLLLHPSSLLAAEQSAEEPHSELEHEPRDSEQYRRNDDQEQYPTRSPSPCLPRLLSRWLLSPLEECRVLSLYDRLVTNHTKRDALMFASLTSKVVTAFCAVVGAIALLGTFFLAVTGGSPYLQFGLALIFFAMFIVGSYWWMVFGPGRGL